MKTLRNILILCLMYPFASCAQEVDTNAVDALFEAWNKPDSPGAALGVIQDGKLIYTKGYGMANLEYGLPNTSQSVFRIGSTSKQFTAACIMLLKQQGKLRLDQTLDEFFPDFPDYAKEINVAHLVHHTSGIRDYLALTYLSGMSDDDHYTDEDLMGYLQRQKDLNFQPGDEWVYSNSGYWLMGQIVEKVSGMNMADFAQKELFEPLGMTNTHFHNDHNQIVVNRASGYAPTEDGYQISMTTLDMIGDGGIFTTIEDILKWDQAYYDRSVLNDAFWEDMTTVGKLNDGSDLDYAGGLFIEEYRGLPNINHGGAFVGFRAELIRFPEQRFSVAIFANRGDADPSGMAYQVADLYLKDLFKDESKTPVEESTEPEEIEEIALTAEELKPYEGMYWFEQSSLSRKLYVRQDTLRYQRSEGNETALLPIAKGEFKMMGAPGDFRIKYDPSSTDRLWFVPENGEPSEAKRYEPIAVDRNLLENYAGTYFSPELDVHYLLEATDEVLILKIEGREVSQFKPAIEGVFTSSNWGMMQFEDKTDQFRLAAGRVKNLLFVKTD